MSQNFLILLLALLLDFRFGDPDRLWATTGHPVVWMGRFIGLLDSRLNDPRESISVRYRNGALATGGSVLIAIAAGVALSGLFGALGVLGFFAEIFVVFSLLAAKSLRDHVARVSESLRSEGVPAGRRAVGHIVGRDPEMLDSSGISRASIESLAENFSDGVVAPAFWYATFGLPGLLAYKVINTADSMIGHRTDRHLYFGRVAAQLDDLANWLPARLAAAVFACAAGIDRGLKPIWNTIAVARTDARLHRSPNAGWPEAAMAAATGVALGGPRRYAEETVAQSWLNAGGKRVSGAHDIDDAIVVFDRACQVLAVLALAGWVVLLAVG